MVTSNRRFAMCGYSSMGRAISILSTDWSQNWDVNFSKNFIFRERHRVQFRAEFDNLFNHVQFDYPLLQLAATRPDNS
jgi:hypothetical protein